VPVNAILRECLRKKRKKEKKEKEEKTQSTHMLLYGKVLILNTHTHTHTVCVPAVTAQNFH